ncbi:MAG: hypothetical protein EB023_11270 [Flavobacteriia bacterium]|nr:hypothetical protein [Flavobacteriia bacterium]
MSPILGIWASARQPALNASSYESIATVTVGSGGAANIEFTSIPSTYTHLQIRGIARNSQSGSGGASVYMQFNSDTGANYSRHYLGAYQGESSAVWAGGAANDTFIVSAYIPNNNLGADIFAGCVIDILDYKNTNKFKTTRTLHGYDINGATVGYSYLTLDSGNWRSTNAITSIKLYGSTSNFMQYSQFALYGIRGA